MTLFNRRKSSAHRSEFGEKFLKQLLESGLTHGEFLGCVNVDFGYITIASTFFSQCEICDSEFVDGNPEATTNVIPDCKKCQRSWQNSRNIRSGLGDGTFAIFGLTSRSGVNPNEPIFDGFAVDLRQDEFVKHWERLVKKDRVLLEDLSVSNFVDGIGSINLGKLQLENKVYVGDIIASSSHSPVVLDLDCRPGNYAIFVIEDKMEVLDNASLPRAIFAIHENSSSKFAEDANFQLDQIEVARTNWEEPDLFMSSGDAKSQIYFINTMLATLSGRLEDAASWAALGTREGNEDCRSSLQGMREDSINFDFVPADETEAVSSLVMRRLP